MTFGLEYDEELEYWLRPGRVAVRVHGEGHCLMETTMLCKRLYAAMIAEGFCEDDIAEEVHAFRERGMDHRSAFGAAILKIAQDFGVTLPQESVMAAREGYAKRDPNDQRS